ncbi:hypothetical protein D3C87_03970 [compost metagenome]
MTVFNKLNLPISFLILMISASSFSQEKEQKLKNLFNEFHVSVNHGIGSGRTFFGAGLGANKVFRAEKIVAFRTGIEFQLFHTWDDVGDPSHFSAIKNIHRNHIDFMVPVAMRINIQRMFIELGGNVGVGVVGWERFTYLSFPLGKPTVQTERKEGWTPGFSMGLMGGIGGLIPLNEKLDLLIRPDVGASVYFHGEFLNLYARLCIGIHLK